jgi:hypothetical protein
MRNLALSVAAILVLAIASPAFAQPFADVPTDHWAFDAIAELAAKGIIEGFPDGTFKGDRGVSRYEVAIIVARILARIEAIKIPAPAPAAAPQVTRTDVQTIQRLVNEFRAELAALGVRTTAVEEELTALKAKTTNVSVSGDMRIRYQFYPDATNNPSQFTTTRYRSRLTFSGQANPSVKVVGRAVFGGCSFAASIPAVPATISACGSSNYTFGPTGGVGFNAVGFDRAYVDISNVVGFNWRIGQWDPTLGAGIGWSGYGLLYDPGNACIGLNAPICMVNGVQAKKSFGAFTAELSGYRDANATGFDIYTARLESASLMAGWTVGAAGLLQKRTNANPALTATTGAGAVTTVTAAAGTTDTGYQVDLLGSVFPGLSVGAAYATFSPDASAGASSNAYAGWVVWDLSTMGLGGLSPTLTAWYKNYGRTATGAGIPWQTGASTEIGDTIDLAWNFVGYGAALDMKLGGGWSGSFSYESGNQNVTPQLAVTEYYASLDYALLDKTTLSFRYFKTTTGTTNSNNFYRVQLTTSF